MIYNAFLQALQEIRRNLMRSLLTAIGIVIGIASVIIIVNIGKGASQLITQSISKLGSNMLFITPGQEPNGPPTASISKAFKIADVEVLKNSILAISAISPVESTSMIARYKDQNYRTTINGLNNDAFKVYNHTLVSGRWFEQNELRTGQKVCIVGKTIVKKLFLNKEHILGQKIKLSNFSCEVVGILGEKGANALGMDQDDVIAVPIQMFQRRISGNDNVHLIITSVKKNIPAEEVSLQIRKLMREIRHIKDDDDDFTIDSMKELLDIITNITSLLTLFLGAVAAISLVVGGIGIMNIMLVSVTERTREIGIRMATGAMAGDILTQFIIESIVLSGLGGIVGILLGLSITYGVSLALDIALLIDPSIIVIALVFSMFIGIIFGIIPAKKAANMNPIDALRYE